MPVRSVCLVTLSPSEAGPGRFGRQVSFMIKDIYHTIPYHTIPYVDLQADTTAIQIRPTLLYFHHPRLPYLVEKATFSPKVFGTVYAIIFVFI